MTAIFGQAYSAYETTDESGRIGDCVGWYSSEQGALIGAKGIGWWGGLGAVKVHPTISVDGKTFVLLQADPINIDRTAEQLPSLLASAKSKLTQEEWDALVSVGDKHGC